MFLYVSFFFLLELGYVYVTLVKKCQSFQIDFYQFTPPFAVYKISSCDTALTLGIVSLFPY